MIKLEKSVTYYLKRKYHHTATIEKKTFYTPEEAIEYFKKQNISYYINDKDITALEEIKLYIPTSYGMKKYYKQIDPELKVIESNYKEED